MKNLLGILKGSPIVIVSLLVVVGCIAFLLFVVQSGGDSFKEEVKGRKSALQEIRSLEATSFSYPDPDPDAPYKTAQAAINDVTLKALDQIHNEMNDQFKNIFEQVANYNRTGDKGGQDGPNEHNPMYNGLFPSATADDVLYGGKIAYLKQIKDMLGSPSPTGDDKMPRINAGKPHTYTFQEEELEKVAKRFLTKRLLKSEAQLSKADAKTLWSRKRERLEQIITGVAKSIDVYITGDDVEDSSSTTNNTLEYPLHIEEWANQGTRPNLRDLWEGQMGLWIQQDILRAIQRANSTKTKLNTDLNVITNPVKHLLSVRVMPGYVGVNSGGAMGTLDSFEGLRGAQRTQMGATDDFISEYKKTQADMLSRRGMALESKASKKLVEHFSQQSPDRRLPDDFKTAPTGRVSNKLYDVRHARIEVIVDYQQLPIFLKELARVNFMTVLKMSISDVDEYESLRQGYYYGQADAVKVEMLIETIWLRDWTVDLMPQDIRNILGIGDDSDESNN